jgi:hypothetical protein
LDKSIGETSRPVALGAHAHDGEFLPLHNTSSVIGHAGPWPAIPCAPAPVAAQSIMDRNQGGAQSLLMDAATLILVVTVFDMLP